MAEWFADPGEYVAMEVLASIFRVAEGALQGPSDPGQFAKEMGHEGPDQPLLWDPADHDLQLRSLASDRCEPASWAYLPWSKLSGYPLQKGQAPACQPTTSGSCATGAARHVRPLFWARVLLSRLSWMRSLSKLSVACA
jgi:hypothetical protein